MKIGLDEDNREVGFVRVISRFNSPAHSFDSRDHKIRLDQLLWGLLIFGELTVFTCIVQKKNTKPA